MATVLHIQASPMGLELGFSARLGQTFLEAYRTAHPSDRVVTRDLWEADLPAFDFIAASGKYKILRGLEHSAAEASAWKAVIEWINELKAADKLVISTGMWNFGIPYRLKQYLDVIVQPGHTFSFDPATGYTGLVGGKPAMLLLARGGSYPEGTAAANMDFQLPYLKFILEFIGFADVRQVVVEETLTPAADANLAAARTQAREAATRF